MSTLFGFYAAADEEIVALSDGPIRVISVASPIVGDGEFLKAFQSLERLGRLRHLRIANAEDVVTLIPGAAVKIVRYSKGLMKIRSDIYRHCGITLHLKNDPSKNSAKPLFKFKYQKCEGTIESVANDIENFFEGGKNFVKSMKKSLNETHRVGVHYNITFLPIS